jgi:hypothetical protein
VLRVQVACPTRYSVSVLSHKVEGLPLVTLVDESHGVIAYLLSLVASMPARSLMLRNSHWAKSSACSIS